MATDHPSLPQWLFKSLKQSSIDCQGDKIQACLLQRHVLPCSALVVVCWLLIIKILFGLNSASCDSLIWSPRQLLQGAQPSHFTAGEMLLKILITIVLILQPVFLNENVLKKKLIRRKKHFSHNEKINEKENPFFPGMQMIFIFIQHNFWHNLYWLLLFKTSHIIICYLSESRSSGPVKVLKRKLIKTPSVNQFKKQLVKRKIFPHILPEQPSSIPSYPNSTFDTQQNIPAKPSDAKRCKNYL